MTDIYTFTCEMPIVAKERHRVSIVRSKSSPTAIRAHMYTPSTTKAFEEELKLRFIRFMRHHEFPIAPKAPIELSLAFQFASGSNKGKTSHHLKKPDCDNLAKSVLDALNKVLYWDDSYVTNLHVSKSFNEINKDKIIIRFKYL